MSATIAKLPSGGETRSSFDPSDNTVTETTAAGTFLTPASTCALTVPPGTTASSPVWPVASPFWTHYNVCQVSLPFDPVAADHHLDMYDGATKVLQVLVSGETSMTFDFYTLQAAVLTLVGSVTLGTYQSGPKTFDIGLVAGAGGSLTVAVAGTIQFSVGGLDHSGFAGVTQQVHRAFGDGFGAATAAYWSGVIWDGSNTIGRELIHLNQDTNSAVNTGWTGDVSNVNEIPSTDASPLIAAAAGLTSTFYRTGVDLTGKNILAVIGAARMQTVGAGPTHIEITTRIAGANYSSPQIAAGAGYQACTYPWTLNPGTAFQFTPAQAAAAELGVTSAA